MEHPPADAHDGEPFPGEDLLRPAGTGAIAKRSGQSGLVDHLEALARFIERIERRDDLVVGLLIATAIILALSTATS